MNALAEPIQGDIGQETLTQVVSRDELVPQRKRHPWLDIRIRAVSFRLPPQAGRSILQIAFCKLIDQFVEVMPVGIWIRNQFGRKHPVTAIFMNHAVVNKNNQVWRSRTWR